MLLMSLYVVPVLVFTMKIVIQSHACDDLAGTHGGGYAIVMRKSMGPKNNCSYELNDHPNRHLIEREGLPDFSWPIFDGEYITLDDGLVLISWCCVDFHSWIFGVGLNRLKLTIHHDGLDFESSPIVQALEWEEGLQDSGCLCIGDMLICPETDVPVDGHKKFHPVDKHNVST